MPRIYTSASDPIDFCKQCFPDEDDAIERYGNVGDGPDGRGNCFEYEAEHPPYEDHPSFDDGESAYQCEECCEALTSNDN